jgi:L-amino acid N-acyltransferase YncA
VSSATITIRTATLSDAAPISAMLNYYAVNTTATFMTEPEMVETRVEWLMGRPAQHPVVVAEIGGTTVGFASLSRFRSRAAYRHTAELGVYVHPDWHRRGIGRALVREVVEQGRTAGLHMIVAGCCSESAASLGLLESLGFRRVAHFHHVGRKFDRWLDVIFLELMVSSG